MGNINSTSSTSFTIDVTVRVVGDDGRTPNTSDGIVEFVATDTAAVRRAIMTSMKFRKDARDKVTNIIVAMVPLYRKEMFKDNPFEETERLDKIRRGFNALVKECNEIPIILTEPHKFSSELITMLSDQF